MRFVATKSVEQLDLQALHRVRERLVDHTSSQSAIKRFGPSRSAFRRFTDLCVAQLFSS